MWRLIIALVLVMHGAGHVMGIFPVFGLWTVEGQSSRSWLLSGILGDTAASWLSVLLWVAALIGFIGAGLGIMGWLVPYAWWRSWAITAAVLSLLGLVLYWNAFYSLGSKLSALVVDIAVLVALAGLNWPSDDFLGAP
ncbi:MAG: hypothetical protein H3C34_09250 [Caldilineaceae bacterium]|nr:hypothetical protein [Caldilineaceae bacterium]